MSPLRNPVKGDLLKLETDASGTEIGACLLCRKNEEEARYPVKFLSKSLTDTERKWPTHEREALVIVCSLRKFDAYLRGRRFAIYKDNASLKWMQIAKNEKIARWAATMAEYDIEIIHGPGNSNRRADFLSRYRRHGARSRVC